MADDLRSLQDLGEHELEEIRLALVMTGGSSLAVWMGGVTNEVNRLRLGQGVYGQALELLHATARVDVISGTSAGGLNGAVMGLAIARGTENLDSLRRLWQRAGSFDKLFRDPFQPDPPSLLQGDGYFLETLRTALDDLPTGNATSPADYPVDLMMTGSLLVGRDSAAPDDFGSLIVDSDHHALFRFRRGVASPPGDDFVGSQAVARLALAARSSASFPIVFEPSFVPIGQKDAQPGRPDMSANANFTTSRYVLDGGVLMNKPVAPALNAIFALPARRQVRRVLAYVVPDPGERVQEEASPQDEMPTVLRVALDSLVTLPRNESVATELEELKRHNESARLQRDNRFQIVIAFEDPYPQVGREVLANGRGLETAAGSLYPAYLSTRVNLSVARILAHVAEGLNAPEVGSPDAPLWNRDPLRYALEGHRRDFLPPDFPTDVAPAQDWMWGVQTVEHVAAIVLDLLRRPLSISRPRVTSDRTQSARSRLMRQRDAIHAILARLRDVREGREGRFWRDRAAAAVQALSTGDAALAQEWARESFESWPGSEAARTEAEERALLGRLARQVVAALVASASDIKTLTDDDDVVVPGRREEAQTVSTVVDALVGADVRSTLRKLLALHVVETVFAPGGGDLEQVVELIQVSGNTPNGFDGRAEAAGKIAGVKLGHFAAFYKTSWRANDWMWGRLDGAYKLAQILLDPARLRQLDYQAGTAVSRIEEIVLGDPSDDAYETLCRDPGRGWDREKAEAELSFLDPGPDGAVRPLPSSLPVCTRSLARRLQLEILCEELVEVAAAVDADEAAKAYEPPEALSFRDAVWRQSPDGRRLPPAAAAEIFPDCTVGDESVTQEMHSDLFAATASKAAAVVTSVGQGSQLGFSALRGAFAFVRGTVMAVYLMAQNAVRGGAFGYALMVLALAAGAICIAAATLDDDGSNGFLATGVALVGGGFVFAAIRASAPRAIFALLFSVAVVTSPELLGEVADWLERSGSTWAGRGFAGVADFALHNRAVFLMTGLFAGPFLLGVAGRARRLEGFARRHAVVATAVVGGVVALTLAVIVLGVPGDKPDPSVVAFGLAGTDTKVETIKGGWTPDELHQVEVLTAGDFAFIVLYVSVIASVVSLAAGLWTPRAERALWWGRLIPGAVVVAGAFDVVENVLIFRLLGSPVSGDALPGVLWVLAVVKFAIVGIALVYAIAGVVAGCVGASRRQPEKKRGPVTGGESAAR